MAVQVKHLKAYIIQNDDISFWQLNTDLKIGLIIVLVATGINLGVFLCSLI